MSRQQTGPVLIALGANLPGPAGPPAETLAAAAETLTVRGLAVTARSRLFHSAPVPPSGQPDFVNAVVRCSCERAPEAILSTLHEIEAGFGRTRSQTWEARTLDLDLLALGATVIPDAWPGQASRPEPGAPADARPLVLPHPRLHLRAFVLMPLADVAPDWVHPRLGRTAREMLEALPPGQLCRPSDTPWPRPGHGQKG